MTNIFIGIVVILIGLSVLIGLSLIKFLFGVLVILIGIKIVSGFRVGNDNMSKLSSTEDSLNDVIILRGISKTVKSENFKGGKIVSIFNGFEIDLRQSKSSDKVVNMNVTTILSRGKILIPKNWKANIKRTSILGGYENKAENTESETIINIKDSSILGGFDISN